MTGQAWHIGGSEQIQANLGALVKKAQNLAPAWDSVGARLAARERDVFATGNRGKWPPLTSATLRTKGANQGPLIASGLLYEALTRTHPTKHGALWAEWGPVRGSREAKIGVLHASGTWAMPVRDPLPRLTPKERRTINDTLLAYVTGTKP